MRQLHIFYALLFLAALAAPPTLSALTRPAPVDPLFQNVEPLVTDGHIGTEGPVVAGHIDL